MKVLVCGSRTFTDQSVVSKVLNGFDADDSISCVIHGAARGADACGAVWAAISHMPDVLAFPADWARWPKTAGPKRNWQMLREGNPDLVIAFVDKPLEKSRGTAHMVRIARDNRVKTIVVEVLP